MRPEAYDKVKHADQILKNKEEIWKYIRELVIYLQLSLTEAGLPRWFGASYHNATNDWDSGSDLRDLITDGLMASLPKDPINNGSYHYVYEVWNANEDAPGLPGSGSGKPAGWATRICANMLESTGLSYCIFKN
jgi:hypothetical protein